MKIKSKYLATISILIIGILEWKINNTYIVFNGIGTFLILIVLLILLTMPIIYFALYLKDIVFGNSYYVFLRSKTCNKLKILFIKVFGMKLYERIFHKLRRIKRKDYFRYNTPLYSFCFTAFCIAYLISIIYPRIELNEWILFLGISAMYSLCYFIGMYRKIGEDSKVNFLKTIESTQSFLKLSIIPISFIITLIGLISGISGMIDEGISIDMYSLSVIFDELLKTGYNNSNILTLFILLFKFIILSYIFSLPAQLFGIFFGQVCVYILNHGKPYLEQIKLLRGYIKKI